MKFMFRLFLVLPISFVYSSVISQQLHYTAVESRAIHDSIRNSRWDIGGSLSSYSFRYMSEFFPAAIIQRSPTPYHFTVKPKEQIEKIKPDSGAANFEGYLQKRHINSLIVVHRGVIVYEKYLSMLSGDQHTIQSINKVITSALIMKMINEGKININFSIEKYIPELTGSDWQGISVKDILNMRSGMDSASIDFESGPFTNPNHKNYKLESSLGILPKKDNTPQSPYAFIKGLKKDREPGIKAEYSNINTFVLGWLAESVSGKSYANLVAEYIWKPMGAYSDAYICLSEMGIPWPHGGMSVTLRDLARFGMLFTNSEIKKQKERFVSFAQLKEIFDAPVITNMFAPFKWNYQWDLASNGIMMKGGFGGQVLLIHPEKDIVIVYFNYPDKDWGIDNMISDTIISQIIEVLDGNK